MPTFCTNPVPFKQILYHFQTQKMSILDHHSAQETTWYYPLVI